MAHNPGDLIDGIPLSNGVTAPDNDFGEVKPASISGYVFQDGPPIVVDQGAERPTSPNCATASLPPTTRGSSGIVLVLCDASGQPKLDAQGNQITTDTDANGYYQFTNLYPDIYSSSSNRSRRTTCPASTRSGQ